jgi:hypothetical protein
MPVLLEKPSTVSEESDSAITSVTVWRRNFLFEPYRQHPYQSQVCRAALSILFKERLCLTKIFSFEIFHIKINGISIFVPSGP